MPCQCMMRSTAALNKPQMKKCLCNQPEPDKHSAFIRAYLRISTFLKWTNNHEINPNKVYPSICSMHVRLLFGNNVDNIFHIQNSGDSIPDFFFIFGKTNTIKKLLLLKADFMTLHYVLIFWPRQSFKFT